MDPLCDSNFKNKYFAFILYLYRLTDYEDGLQYSFDRSHIEAEAIGSNLIVVSDTFLQSSFQVLYLELKYTCILVFSII
jgi:hypothetical protein